MKKQITRKGSGFFFPAVLSMFAWTACQKATSTTATVSPNTPVATTNLRFSGVVPDDSASKSQVPRIISDVYARYLATESDKNSKGGGTSSGGTTSGGTTGSTSGSTTTVVTSPTLPASIQLAMPPVGNQGSQSSCVAFAVAYATRSAEAYYRTGSTSYSYSTNIFSPAYLYDLTKATSDCSSGSSLLNALNYVYNNGVCLWQTLPYNTAAGCSLLPTSAEITEAANYKIPTYSMLYTSDTTGIKTMLYNHHPLMVAFTADANFYNAGYGYIWNSYSSTFYAPHAVALCGYDDSKHAFLAINSWGTSWGTNGYIYIDYSFLSTIAYDLYVMN